MGIMDALKRELFIDIIEWIEDDEDTIASRYDRKGNDIRNGASLTVREGQVAAFVNEGQLADVFEPGMHELTTENLPILSRLKGWKYGFKSPFKAEVYFVSTRNKAGFGWGTPSPFRLRDPEFGILEMTARGHFSFHVSDPATFLKKLVGTEGEFTKEGIRDRLRKKFITEAINAIADSGKSFYDIAGHFVELSEEIKRRIEVIFFKDYGISLDDTSVQSVDLTERSAAKVEERDDVMFNDGRLDNYERRARADALKMAAGNPGAGGLAAGGMGLGMGMAMANQMGGMYGNPVGQGMGMAAPMAGAMMGSHAAGQMQQAPPPPPMQAAYHLYINGQQAGPFVPQQIAQLIQEGQASPQTQAWKAGMAGWAPLSTIPEMASLFAPPSPQAPPPPPPMD
jgi:membrane protease subunit (stomatin/prohibitin family)